MNFQSMLHPLELMSLVVGKQAIDWSDLEKVRAYKIHQQYIHITAVSTVATRLYSLPWVTIAIDK